MPALPEHAAFEIFTPEVRERLAALGHFPSPREIGALAADVPTARPRWFELTEQQDAELEALGGFDRFIAARGAIPTRRGSTHDLLGGLVWLHFPALKTAIHRLQLASSGPRGPRENAATHLDESGVLVLGSDPSVFERLLHLRWAEAFWERRAELVASARFLAFGHGLLDSLRESHPRLMGKALFVKIDRERLRLDANAFRVFADGAIAERLPEILREPSCLHPLPVLGIPGWHAAQERSFYEDATYFRTQRRSPREPPVMSLLDLSR